MWTTGELKSRARLALAHSYWEGVVVVLLIGLISGAISVVAFIPLAPLAAVFFLSAPLTVGLCFYFMRSRTSEPVVKNMFFPFQANIYMKIVGAMAWKYLFLFLWLLIPMGSLVVALIKGSFTLLAANMHDLYTGADNLAHDVPFLIVCLFIYVAGFVIVTIKTISYSMTEFILTDNPMLPYNRALSLSIAMTNGHKGHIFLLYLSFIGWYALVLLTCGLGMIFLSPYLMSTQAELYVKLRENAIYNGLCVKEELNLFDAPPGI